MPQAIDLAALTRKTSAVPRRSSSPEPTGRFDDVLNQQTRRAERDDAPPEARRQDDAKPARKVEKKSKPDAEAPAEDVEAAEPQEPAAETAPAEESSDEAAPEEDGSDPSANDDAEAKDPAADVPAGEVDPEMLANLLQQAQPGQPTGDVVELDDGAQALTEIAAAAQAKPIDPAGAAAAAAAAGATDDTAESADGKPAALGGALAIPKEAETDTDETPIVPQLPEQTKTAADASKSAGADLDADLSQPLQATESPKSASAPQPPTGPQPIPIAPERQFAEDNVERIVSTVKTQIMPTGGSMKIRLDPPNLGTLNVDITVDEGVLTASFQTSNDEATRLLSHSMQHLKNSLETAGVSVDRIQVKQASSSEQSSSQQNEQDRQQQNPQDHPARQEQQRREMLQKMWRKLALGEEPLDLVA